LKFLLDTHIWIWFVDSPERIRGSARSHLAAAENELWLSPISTWEVLMLQRKQRIRLSLEPMQWLQRATAGIQYEAPLTHEIVREAHRLQLHGDPADRFLAATAQVHDLTLVTADQRLLGLGTIRTMANR
jgi:PIN domain nuclease of toxin-antitoxin system